MIERHLQLTLLPYTTLFRSRPELRRQSAERRSERDTSVRGGREPSQPLCAILWAHRVGDVRLDDADRPAACPLDEDRKSIRLNSSHVESSHAVISVKYKRDH